MKLPLAYYGDPVLRKKVSAVEKIDDTIRQLVEDMIETMEKNDGGGLAAPQVHKSLALFITCIPKYIDDRTVLPGKVRVYINPKILAYSNEVWMYPEGCLSIPGLREAVERPVKIRIEAMNLEGETFIEEFEGYDARVFLHENDHLNGVLYVDRLHPKRKKAIESTLRAIKKKYCKS